MILKPSTWINYIDEAKGNTSVPEKFMMKEVNKLISLHATTSAILSHTVPITYLLDYTTGKYLMVSKNCKTVMGFTSADIICGGIVFFAERYHPEDLRLFNEEVFVNMQQILNSIPKQEHKDHIFNFNYRIRDSKGEYINLLQRSSFIKSDDKGNPLISLGVVTKVDHFVKNNPVIQVVERVDPVNGTIGTVVKNTYFLHEENKIFSKREREVLLYIAEGFTSKQIADKLFISEHTVINHKRSMHSKSNTQNAAALMSFAFKHNMF